MGALSELLPTEAPSCANRRLLLYTFRRVAAHGLNDAHAAAAMLSAFGRSYRRPLVLLRALAAELSRASSRKLLVAPCCCGRTTTAEAVLLEAVAMSLAEPHCAHSCLAEMLGVRECIGTLSSAQALAQAFEDLGRPLAG